MGILPLQFMPGQSAESLELSGEEIYAIGDAPGQLKAMLDSKFADGRVVDVIAETYNRKTVEVSAQIRLDTPQEILYYRILQYVLRQLAGKA
jgi:aconitate hydratase